MTVTRRLDARSTARMLAMALAAVLALAALPLGVASAQENGDDEFEYNGEIIFSDADPEAELIASLRFAGQQRFATAALIAVDTWGQSDRAILARHDEWPDALAGGYLAGILGAPVLLVSQQNLQDDTLNALEELGVSEITILGGTQAISEASENRLSEDFGYEVDRIAGETRFETAAEIAASGDVGELDELGRTAFVATGINFADALTAGPLAYDGNFPILLTPSQSLHPATEQALQDLEIDHVVLLGGTNAISAGVADAIADAIDGDDEDITRLSGTTRIETAAAVAGFAFEELGFSPFEHGWARGNDFADALTIGPRLGELGGPLLLVPTPTVVDSGEGTNAAVAEAVRCDTSLINIAGGFAAISESSEDTLRSLLACPEEPFGLALFADTALAVAGEESIEVTALLATNVGGGIADAELDFGVDSLGPGDVTVTGDLETVTDAEGQAVIVLDSDAPALVEVTAATTVDDVVLEAMLELEFTLEGETSAFFTELSSAQETDEDTAALDPPVTGFSVKWLNSDTGEICWGIRIDPIPDEHDVGSFEGFALPTNAHIHVGEPGEDGAIVVELGQVQDATLVSTGCETVVPAVLEAIEEDAAGYYVNVHTDEYPGGIVRGQLAFDDNDDDLGAAFTETRRR